jgi:hypothetical protein
MTAFPKSDAWLRSLPSRAPKDSEIYQRWLAARNEGMRQARRPVFPTRFCECGASFRPRVWNGKTCAKCIARQRARGIARRDIVAENARLRAALEEVSWVAERFVDTDLAHDDPARAVAIMGQMIDFAREATP